MKIEVYIKKFNPCSDSKEYLRQFDTFQQAWNACHRGDWLLSAASLLGVDLQVRTLAKGLCANTVRHLMKDPRSIAAVDAAIAFGRGEIGREKLDAATHAATYASTHADAAAFAAAHADAAHVDAAAFAATHADAAWLPDAAARKANQQQTADICREVLTEAVFERIKA